VVALDGPSGTGKSTRRADARADDWVPRYLDTRRDVSGRDSPVLDPTVDVREQDRVADAVRGPNITISTDPESGGIELDGRAVRRADRSAPSTAAVSAVSAVPAVRTGSSSSNAG